MNIPVLCNTPACNTPSAAGNACAPTYKPEPPKLAPGYCNTSDCVDIGLPTKNNLESIVSAALNSVRMETAAFTPVQPARVKKANPINLSRFVPMQVKDAANGIKEAAKGVAQYVAENPGKSAAAAAGIGVTTAICPHMGALTAASLAMSLIDKLSQGKPMAA